MGYTSIKIAARKDRARNGLLPIYLYFSQNRKRNKIALGKKVPEKSWIGIAPNWVKERGAGAYPNAKALNYYFSKQLAKANKILLDAENNDDVLSFAAFKKRFLRKKYVSWKDLHEDYISRKKSKKHDLSPHTIRRQKSYMNNVLNYAPQANVKDIDLFWIQRYAKYMYEKRNNGDLTIYKNLKYIQGICDEAIRQGLLRQDPFEKYLFSYSINEKPALTIGEVKRMYALWQSKAIKERLHKVLTYFLFQCYTGIDYGDLKDLDYKDFTEINGKKCLKRKRCKNENPYIVPLGAAALYIVGDIEGTGKVFQPLTNQKYNEALKEIAAILGFHKKLTTHIARHTFASVLANNGVREEIIRQYLGQKTLRITAHYTKYEIDTLINEFKYEHEKDH